MHADPQAEGRLEHSKNRLNLVFKYLDQDVKKYMDSCDESHDMYRETVRKFFEVRPAPRLSPPADMPLT